MPDPKPNKPTPKPKPPPKPKDNLAQLRTKSKNITDWIHDAVLVQATLKDSKAAPAFVSAQIAELGKWHDKFRQLQQLSTELASRANEEGTHDKARQSCFVCSQTERGHTYAQIHAETGTAYIVSAFRLASSWPTSSVPGQSTWKWWPCASA